MVQLNKTPRFLDSFQTVFVFHLGKPKSVAQIASGIKTFNTCFAEKKKKNVQTNLDHVKF